MVRNLFLGSMVVVMVGCGESDDSGAAGGSGGTGQNGGSGGATSGGGTGGALGGSAGSGGASGGAAGAGVGGAGGVGGGAGGPAGGSGGVAGSSGAGGGANPGIPCGPQVCIGIQACEICNPGGAQSPKTCITGGTTCSSPSLLLFCDDKADCPNDGDCYLVPGSTGTTALCIDSNTCVETCCSTRTARRLCNTLADCPACATSCVPYQPSPGQTFPVKICEF